MPQLDRKTINKFLTLLQKNRPDLVRKLSKMNRTRMKLKRTNPTKFRKFEDQLKKRAKQRPIPTEPLPKLQPGEPGKAVQPRVTQPPVGIPVGPAVIDDAEGAAMKGKIGRAAITEARFNAAKYAPTQQKQVDDKPGVQPTEEINPAQRDLRQAALASRTDKLKGQSNNAKPKPIYQ